MFINFPVNYGNRMVSEIADAMNPNMNSTVRKRALGSILRRVGMTMLIAGPMALPIIQEMTNEVSENDSRKGAWLRRTLAPVQNAWAATFGRMSMGRNMSRFGYFAPITEMGLNIDRRVADEPLVKLVEDTWHAMGFGGAPHDEYVAARQRMAGALTTHMFADTPEPESNLVPEPFVLYAPYGRAVNDIVNFAIAQRNIDAGLTGPLDTSHGARPTDSPWLRLLFGESEATAMDRRNARWAAREVAESKARKQRFINSIVSPHASDRERQQAMDAFVENLGVLDMPTTDMYLDALKKAGMTPAQRQILQLPHSALTNLIVNENILERLMPPDIGNAPLREQVDKMNLYLTFLAAYNKGGRSATPDAAKPIDLETMP
jgi:hypothetical protein